MREQVLTEEVIIEVTSIVTYQRVHEFFYVQSAFLMEEKLFGKHEDAGYADDSYWYSHLKAHQHHLRDAEFTRHLHHELAHFC